MVRNHVAINAMINLFMILLLWGSEPPHNIDYLVWNQRDCPYRVTLFTPDNRIYTSFEVLPKQIIRVSGQTKFKYFKIFFIKSKINIDCGCVEIDDCPGCISIDRFWSDGGNFAVRQNINDKFMIVRDKCINL